MPLDRSNGMGRFAAVHARWRVFFVVTPFIRADTIPSPSPSRNPKVWNYAF